MHDLHKLFWNPASECFLKALNIDNDDETQLRLARKKVRDRLRIDIPKAVRKHFKGVLISPKFFPQGSYAYKTLNAPAHCPPQQGDIDDGCYLPMSFLEHARPSISSELFFTIVDASLEKLAEEEGWRHIKKPTCSRLVINKRLHIDVPLYAIPDVEFLTLQETLNYAESSRNVSLRVAYDNNDTWAILNKDQVLLACRDGNWRASDPREVNNWLKRQVALKTEQLRRIIRYLKAWRDYQWCNGSSPTSILLMSCADYALKSPIDGDHMALLKVAEQLPNLFTEDIPHPTDTGEILSDHLDEKGIRTEAIAKSKQLYTQLNKAILCDDAQQVAPIMNQLFGSRFQVDINNIKVIKPATIYQSKRTTRIQERPLHGRREAG